MQDWITCPSCEEEFRIVSDCMESPMFCPFCAEDLEEEIDEDLDEDE